MQGCRDRADDGCRLRHDSDPEPSWLAVRQGARSAHALDGDGDRTAIIIRDMCLRSGAGFPDALVLDQVCHQDAKFKVFCAWVKSMGSCLSVGSANHKNTNARVERANGVVS